MNPVGGPSELVDRTTIELSSTSSGDDGDPHDTEEVVKESGDFGTQQCLVLGEDPIQI